MAFSGEHRPLDCSLPHELTCETPCPSLKLYFLIGILSLSALCIALLVYLCVLRSRISKKREVPAKGTNSRESVGPSYEVFLSFHGRDTRHGFTDFLYRGMVETGILLFRDNESLHVGQRIGDELLQAIRNSKIYIPIFSKNYASSHWCLRELAHMVECASKSNGNKEILPIFLDVEPDDVKLKTNLYIKALSKHQKKFCTEVESWKKALVDVDGIKGWNLKTDESLQYNSHRATDQPLQQVDGHSPPLLRRRPAPSCQKPPLSLPAPTISPFDSLQVDLIRSIIQTVLTKLNVGFKKNVTEDLVGVDDRVEAIIKMLHVGSNSVQFLGLYGMGGIGKTTLAKVIFNQLSSQFQGCNFLSDVGESSRRHGLVHLQKQLLSKFPESRSILDQIHDVDDGINMIKRVLCNKKVLVVLDDVDEREQLRTLADKGDWFGFGSRIIITTRDQRVLTIQAKAVGEGPTNISAYEVYKMEYDHALKLFSRHAFRRDSPLDHYISISKKIVRALGNLPLAIEIIGSSLNGKSEALWEDTLKKLKKLLPWKSKEN
ncbi:disease resistance protein L6-like [Rutidosis leptorrhynchoides]|uniref:disease resistance protein L6-like n=1 Tax=Rutidosis leptorrhynchoides TaxID=125765 RepID=UPI003A99EE4A